MRMLIRPVLVLLPLLLSRAALLLAQTPGTPGYDPKFVPDASGKNLSIGNIYSPNLFEGSANVTIPIYGFKNEYGSYGVALSYNTKGIKVDQLSGKAGLQWNVMAGGAITRTVKDIPDELDAVHQFSASGPNTQIWNSKGRLALYQLNGNVPINTQQDGENDEFNVAFAGLNFTFNLGKDGYVFTHPKRRAKIVYTGTGVDMKFTITDEQGIVYRFEPGDQRTSWINNYDKLNSPNLLQYFYVSRWVLKEAVFPDGSIIKYKYSYAELPETLTYRKVEHDLSIPAQNSTTGNSLTYVKLNEGVTHVSELTSIEYPNGTTVTFVPEAAPGANCYMPFKEIVVTAPNADCQRFRLNKKYLVSTGINTTDLEIAYTPSCDFNSDYNLRMILKSVDIYSCDESTHIPFYSFDYLGEKLPSRLSNAQDVFGYYNGAAPNSMFNAVPSYTWYGNTYGVDRSVTNTNAIMAAGNLIKVTNAYGGTVNFEYEVNNGLTTVKTDLPNDPLFLSKGYNDGLRIKQIKETDRFHPGNARISTFQYSGGQRYLDGGYFHYLSKVDPNASGIVPTNYTMGAFFISPHQLINGSNHGYSKVSVSVTDQSGNLLSRTETNFTNFKDGNQLRFQLNNSNRDFYQEPFTDKQYIRDWEIGLPTEINTYDQNNQLVTRVSNVYSFTTDLTSAAPLGINTKTMRVQKGTNVNPFTSPVVAQDTYLPYTGKAYLMETKTENFVNINTAVIDEVEYEYDNRDNIISTITTNSKDEKIKTSFVYNYHVSGLGTPYGNHPGTFLYDLTNAGVEKLVSTEKWLIPETGTEPFNYKLLNATINVFAKNQEGGIYSKSALALTSRDPISYQQYTGLSLGGQAGNPYNRILTAYNTSSVPANFRRISEVTLTDAQCNPLETRLQNLEQYKAMIWDTTTGRKMADVVNARYSDIAYSGFECSNKGNLEYETSDIAVAFNPAGSISGKKTLRGFNGIGVLITTSLTPNKEYLATFWVNGGIPRFSGGGIGDVPLGMASEKGSWKFYQGRFTPVTNAPMVLSINGSQIGYSFIDEVRVFPSESLMESYNYDGNNGLSSSTDPTGRLSYFEFDKLGRPTVTRDQEGNILSRAQYYINQ